MNYIEFFTTDNKSGWKTREDVLKNKEPKIYNELKKFINDNNLYLLPFKQQVWHFIHNDKDIKKCLNCGDDVKFKDSISKGYRSFCSMKCTNESDITQKRAVDKVREKFGVDYFPQHESHILKVKETKLKRYGDENYNNITKTLKTKEEIHGFKNYNNSNKNKITTRDNLLIRLDLKTSDKLIKYDIEDSNITLNCSSCGSDYEIYNTLFNYRTEINIKPCTICNPINSSDSFHQKELADFIISLLPNENVIQETKKIIPPLELDIYIENKKLAIEFDGLYWHSNKFLDSKYHLNKTNQCRALDIDLLHVFEDEWIYKKDIVKSVIKSKLGLSDNVIYGRKCIIKEVSVKDSRKFLDENHLQGYTNSNIRLGLYYSGELISIMTFGNLRKVLSGVKEEGSYELIRFSNKLNTNVIGGFSKLFNYFTKTIKFKEIITYSDNRYFNGEVYKKVGFTFLYETKPNYSYIIKHKREYRFKYRKDVLVKEGYDKDKSESKIMEERGINKIYDSGNKKWIYKKLQISLTL